MNRVNKRENESRNSCEAINVFHIMLDARLTSVEMKLQSVLLLVNNSILKIILNLPKIFSNLPKRNF